MLFHSAIAFSILGSSLLAAAPAQAAVEICVEYNGVKVCVVIK